MSIIEQATRRLEELRRSGIEVPSKPASVEAESKAASTDGVPARVARMLEAAKVPAGDGFRDPGRPSLRDVSPSLRPEPVKESRHIDIDLARLAAMGYLTPETPRAQIADEFRVVKRPLLVNLHAKSAQPMADRKSVV